MDSIPAAGQVLTTEIAKVPLHVKRFLGDGGQGSVFQADLGGTAVALKWYKPESATAEQRQSITALVRKGAPSGRFLWPQDLVISPSISGFGYVMPLRGSNFRGIIDLMRGRIAPSFKALATAGFQLADSFLQLHARGYSYCDISFGNVFFDPVSGDVQICDCDNVVVTGSAVGVVGTPRFMAPEIVRGEARPNAQTDQFSLAVLLFYMFVMHHPLFGAKEAAVKCLDSPALTKLCGTEPLFVFHPTDRSNAPDPTYQGIALAYWPLLPKFIQDMFAQSFTLGLHDTGRRIVDSKWKEAMIRLRDSIVYCANCSSDPKDPTQNFCDIDAATANNGAPGKCFNCRRPLVLPPRLQLSTSTVMLNHDTLLFPHHTDSSRIFDFATPTAMVNKHPTLANVWGLRNASSASWTFARSDGTTGEVRPGQNVPISAGTTIRFGNVDGVIRI